MRAHLQAAALVVAMVCVCQLVWAQSAEDLRRLDELDAICLKAREARIRVAQREKIEECVQEVPQDRSAKKSRGECETYFSDYGWTTGALAGSRRPSLYAELPECTRAFEARQPYRAR